MGEALLAAKQDGQALDIIIEAVVGWEALASSVSISKNLTQPASFDFLPQAREQALTLRRYTPALLEALPLQATPASQSVLAGLEVLKTLHQNNGRKLPDYVPTGFIRPRWEPIIFTDTGMDRRGYELCVLDAMKKALHSGDMSVQGSRQFKDFETYLLPQSVYQSQKTEFQMELAVTQEGQAYLKARCQQLNTVLTLVERLALRNQLPDARFGESGLIVTPLDKAVPDESKAFSDKVYALLPRVKITELLLEVDTWTNFSGAFTHLKTDTPCADKALLLTPILADAINLGLVKMAEASPQTTYAKLSWIQSWHIRDLADRKLYTPDKTAYPTLKPMLGGTINLKIIEAQWDEILRLAASIRHGKVNASLILRKLGSYPRQNSLALSLRELGRMERTLFLLQWMQDVDLRRRVQVSLNKGEERNALARAVFFNRLGEFRDRDLENQQYRASGLNLVITAITLWNTVYLDKAISLLSKTQPLEPALLAHLSPLKWEHINLTGDYHWPQKDRLPKPGHFRPLRFP